MKLDYKPQEVQLGSLQKRHLVRVLLGCLAVLCLSLTFIKKNSHSNEAAIEGTEPSQTLASAKTTKNTGALSASSNQNAKSSKTTTDPSKSIPDLHANSHAKNNAPAKKLTVESSRVELARASDTLAPTVKKDAKLEKLEKLDKEAKLDKQGTLDKQGAKGSVDAKSSVDTSLKETEAEVKAESVDSKAADTTSAAKGSAFSIANQEWDIIKVQKGDTLAKIFKRQGYVQKDLDAIMGADPKSKKQLIALKTGQDIRFQANEQKQVQALSIDVGKDQILNIARQDNKFLTEYKQQPIEKQIAFGKGKVNHSLSLAGKRAGLDQNIISQMVEIFGWNIDFSTDLQPSDTFRVLFEEKRVEGEKIGSGHILAAEIISKGKKHQAVRYTDKTGHSGYFSPEGQGLRQAFLRYPVEFTRISSGFGNRNHPIFHRMKKHNGVDLAAPKGTPVKSTGDGKVIFVGNRGGYGKVVEIQHGPQYSTLYGHLSKFSPKLKAGSNVKQGDIIGNVGRTGLATGPHLHYEFRVAGIHRDPLTINLPRKNPIPDANKRQFIAHAKEMLRLMDIHENKVNVVQNQYHEDE